MRRAVTEDHGINTPQQPPYYKWQAYKASVGLNTATATMETSGVRLVPVVLCYFVCR